MEETWAYTLCSLLFLVVLVSKLLFASEETRNKKLPPGPPKLPILGHLHLLKDPVHQSFQQLSDKYGRILYLRFGYRGVMIVSSPSLVEECFTRNDIVLAARPRLLASKYLHYNNTTLGAADYGNHWRNLRRLTALEILSTNRLNNFLEIRREEVKFLVKNLFRSTGSQGFVQVEMKSRLSELSFNVIVRMVAGKRYFGIGVEDKIKEEAEKFRDLTREIFYLSGSSNLTDYLPVLGWVGYGNYEKRLAAARREMDTILQGLIDGHRKKRLSACKVEEEGSSKTMVDLVLELQESEPEYYSDEII